MRTGWLCGWLLNVESRCPPACPQEFYCDFIALDRHHFMVPVPSNDVLINPRAAAALGASE
jgi:hypothetical protein